MRRLYQIIKQRRFHPDKTPSEFDGSLPFLPPAIELGPPIPQHCTLFELPTEIYTLILASAFSGHHIHINLLPLSLSHLSQPNFLRYDKRSDAAKKRHKTWSRYQLAVAKMMVWRGCVCDRTVAGEDPNVRPTHSDFCLHGEGRCHQMYPRNETDYHTLDALGFLLSCRQGYFDLVHMLYTTNTFILNTHRLAEAILAQVASGMPRIISPMIHQVTSLELFVGFRLFHYHHVTQDGPTPDELSERQRFQTFVDLLSKAFPNLQSLHIFFDNGISYGDIMMRSHIEHLKTEFFEPMRLLARKLPRLRHFSIAIEHWIFNPMLFLDGMTGEKYRVALETEGLHGMKAWYPPGVSKEDRGCPGTGFWVKKGTTARRILSEENKMLYGLVCCPGCFRGCTD